MSAIQALSISITHFDVIDNKKLNVEPSDIVLLTLLLIFGMGLYKKWFLNP